MFPSNENIDKGYHQEMTGALELNAEDYYRMGYGELYTKDYYAKLARFGESSPEIFLARIIARHPATIVGETGDVQELRRRSKAGKVMATMTPASRLEVRHPLRPHHNPGLRYDPVEASELYFWVAKNHSTQSDWGFSRLQQMHKDLPGLKSKIERVAIERHNYQKNYRLALNEDDSSIAIRLLSPYYRRAIPDLIERLNPTLKHNGVITKTNDLHKLLNDKFNFLDDRNPKGYLEWQHWLTKFTLTEQMAPSI